MRKCLASAMGRAAAVVYVDSGSSDGSAALAASMGATVVELDLSVPFTAARARNEGWQRLVSVAPEVDYVMFVDGDCEIIDGFLERGAADLMALSRSAAEP